MPRYIDADALKELIDGGYDIDFDEVPETKNALLHMIDYQETADVVEVVRCKDCKHYGDDHFCCYPWCTTPEEFCSRGERKEDD